jgi:hypothetical protein
VRLDWKACLPSRCSQGTQVAGGEIRIARGESGDSRDVRQGSAVSLVGPFQQNQKYHYEVAVADGWRFQCTTKASTPSVPGKSGHPNGPYVAACYVSASIFKVYRSVDATIDLTYSVWNWARGEWACLEVGIEPAAIAVGSLYAIGLGAVGAASILTLAATHRLEGQVILVDPQSVGRSLLCGLVMAAK